MKDHKARIAVVGSINMDLVVQCERLPHPGQTVLASKSQESCGGKGANQAVAAARAGGEVTMIGRVGDDAYADRLLKNLQSYGVMTQSIQSTHNCGSGVAIVAVERSGQNSIMVVPGANGYLSPNDLQQSRVAITESDVLLLQLEIPVETVIEAIRIAKSGKTRVILDPAPAPTDWISLLRKIQEAVDTPTPVDVICPNETEAVELSGLPVGNLAEAELAAKAIYAQGFPIVVITLGSQGALLYDGNHARLIPSYPITPLDTTAAGDAFAGALGVKWAETYNFLEAIHFANAAGAIAATKVGAQISLPSRAEIEAFTKQAPRFETFRTSL